MFESDKHGVINIISIHVVCLMIYDIDYRFGICLLVLLLLAV